MRKLFVLALIALTMNSYAQCPTVVCTRTQALHGNTANGNFTIPGVPVTRLCFRGQGAIGTAAIFSPTWGWFSFRDTIVCQKQLIMPVGSKILAKDSIQLYYVKMSGSDTLINQGGYLRVDTLISSGSTAGQYNIIMVPYTNSAFNYRDTAYYPGDTIPLSSNADSNVLVIACSNVPLAIDYISIERQGDYLVWEYDEQTMLFFSEDGKQFTMLPDFYYGGVVRYKIDRGGYYKAKSFDKESKTLKVVYDQEERQKRIIYFYNNQFTKVRPQGVPVVGTKTLR